MWGPREVAGHVAGGPGDEGVHDDDQGEAAGGVVRREVHGDVGCDVDQEKLQEKWYDKRSVVMRDVMMSK